MKKKSKGKWKKIVLWSLVSLLIVGMAGLFAVNYAVNKVMESMSEGLDAELTTDVPASNKPSPSPNDESQSTDTAAATATQQVQPSASATPDVKPSTSSQTNTQAAPSDEKKDKPGVYDPKVTTKKAKAINESVTLSEKAAVTSILMGHLSIDEVNQLKVLAKGGLTVDKKRQARKILLEKLTPKEYDKLSAIAKKYGVSRGKTYSQAVKEEANSKK